MSRDVLSNATRALRAQHDGASQAALETERRVLSRLRQQNQRRDWRLRWLLPAVAVLVVSSAAASVGRVFPALSRLIESWFEAPTQSASRAPHPTTPSSPAPRSAPDSATPEASALPTPPPEPSPADSPKGTALNRPPKHAAAPALSGSAPLAATPAPTPPPNPEELYRAAHRLHFVDRNPQAALVAWDRYLQAAPRGALVLEARYNRALALARLGRHAEAVSALQAFARGEYGPYRQAEAQALITKLAP